MPEIDNFLKTIKSRYIIAAVNKQGNVVELLEDFYALTYAQAQFRVGELSRDTRALLPNVTIELFEASTLENWMGDMFGCVTIVRGRLCFQHDLIPDGQKFVCGADQFASNLDALQHDLDVICKADGSYAVTYGGVLWAQSQSAQNLLAHVGAAIDTAYAHYDE